jgi:hypothetical protein
MSSDDLAPRPEQRDARSRRQDRRSRRPGPPAAFPWRWIFPGVLVLLGVVTVVLGVVGGRLVLDSQDGAVVRVVRDPSQPGYFAQVAPTPTLLVVQIDENRSLVSTVVMSLSAGDTGGSALLFPPELLVPVGGGSSEPLARIHLQRGIEGPGGLRPTIARLIGADVDSVVVVDAGSLAAMLAPVAPVRYTLLDAVRTVSGGRTVTLLPKGSVAIRTASDVRAATEVVSAGEDAIARLPRQIVFWKGWIDALRAAPDKSAAFPAADDHADLVRFLKGLSSGIARIERIPWDEVVFRGVTLYIADEEAIAEVALQVIPYPLPYEPGARPRVEVRNGVGDFRLNEPMNRRLVAAGAQIIVLGNARSFDVAQTSVVYYDPGMRGRAEQLAEAIDATDVRLDERPESSIDVTVTIGSDFVP